MSRDRSSTEPTKKDLDQNVTVIRNYIVTEERLGRGSSATVYLGYHRKKKIKVAVKKFEIPPNNPRVKRRAHREFELLRKLKHPNIIRLYDFHYDMKKNDIYLFLEYCPRGSMRTFLGKGGYIDENNTKRLLKQLCSALNYLMKMGIYHRDMKPQNLLLSKNYNLKISDFGLATMNMKGTFRRLCGSPLYMAPEILTSSSYNKRSDLWSIGIVLFEFLFGHHPFKKMNGFAELVHFVRDGVDIEIPPSSRPKNVNISDSCADLLKKLLVTDPDQRMKWADFFHHPWFNEPDDSESKNVKREPPMDQHADTKSSGSSQKPNDDLRIFSPFEAEIERHCIDLSITNGSTDSMANLAVSDLDEDTYDKDDIQDLIDEAGDRSIDLRFAHISPDVYSHRSTMEKMIKDDDLDCLSNSSSINEIPISFNTNVFSPQRHLTLSEPGKKKRLCFQLEDVLKRSCIEERRKMSPLDLKVQEHAMLIKNINQPRTLLPKYQTLPSQLPSNEEVFHVSLGRSPAKLHCST